MFTFLSIFLLVIQVFCVSIPIINKSKETNTDKIKYSNWDKALLTFSIIAFGLAIAVFLFGQDAEKEKENQVKDYQIELKNKLAERDLVHQRDDSVQTKFFIDRLDSSYSNSIRASNEALAKYNLVLVDSLNRVTNKINVKSINKPQLLIAPSEAGQVSSLYLIKDSGQIFLAVKIKSNNNTSYNIKLKYCILNSNFKNNLIIYNAIDTGYYFFSRKFLVQDVISTARIQIEPEFLKIDNSIIFFQGTFSSDRDNLDISNFEDAYFFDFKNNKQYSPLDDNTLNDIKLKLQKRGILK